MPKIVLPPRRNVLMYDFESLPVQGAGARLVHTIGVLQLSNALPCYIEREPDAPFRQITDLKGTEWQRLRPNFAGGGHASLTISNFPFHLFKQEEKGAVVNSVPTRVVGFVVHVVLFVREQPVRRDLIIMLVGAWVRAGFMCLANRSLAGQMLYYNDSVTRRLAPLF